MTVCIPGYLGSWYLVGMLGVGVGVRVGTGGGGTTGAKGKKKQNLDLERILLNPEKFSARMTEAG